MVIKIPKTLEEWKVLPKPEFVKVIESMHPKELIESKFLQTIHIKNIFGLPTSEAYVRRAPFMKGKTPEHLKPFSELMTTIQTGRRKLSPKYIHAKMGDLAFIIRHPQNK